MKDVELIGASACALVARLRTGEITPHDLLAALEARIGAVDGKVNALPTRCFERARAHADRLLQMPPDQRGPLFGMPVAIKDLVDVAGVRSTRGSPIFADHVPATSDIVVETIERAGGIVYAMSNTPEFGAGANTFNEVFGATRNPWNTRRSAAGSSGGSAAALASGMAWLAHGTDVAGSLRSPASFCGVVGMRPSIGRVAQSPESKIDRNLSQHGPMARNVEDLALLLDAMSGEHPGDPTSLPRPATSFLDAARSNWRPKRVAYSATLGITPVEPEVAAITRAAAARFAEAGAVVEEAHPDLAEAHACFQVLRAFDYAISKAKLLRAHRALLKPEVVWNVEAGLKLTIDEIERAEAQRLVLTQRMLDFFARYDLLLTPTTIVAPFPVEERYVAACGGKTFDSYFEWLAIVYAITLVCAPALSLPCGFTREKLPVGLQIVGPPRADARVLAGAKALEEILDLQESVPIDPREENAANPRHQVYSP
jgi:amidase